MEPQPTYGVFRVRGRLFRWELAKTDNAGYLPWRPLSYHLTRWDATRRMKRLLKT